MGKSRSKAKKNDIGKRRDAGVEDLNKHECLFCNCFIPNSEELIVDHYLGKKHRRLEKLHMYMPFFQEEGLICSDSGKTFECTMCKKAGIPADTKKLKAHLLDVHFVSPQKNYPSLLADLQLWSTEGQQVHILQKIQRQRPKTYWVDEFNLEDENCNFDKVVTPTLCLDLQGSSIHFFYVNARFSTSLLGKMVELATFLEARGNPTKRGEMKSGDYDTKIVTFGFRYAYGEIGRFRHGVHSCYSQADELCSIISDHLKEQFPTVFDHLEAILDEEGITDEDNIRLGNSPFTTMSVTCDYTCNIHVDADDVSYGFFVWFGCHGTQDKYGNEVHFYLPGIKLFTIPSIGDVFLCKASELVHCTKTIGSRGQFGVALYQKASFFRWYAILKNEMFSENAIYQKLLTSWLESSNIEY